VTKTAVLNVVGLTQRLISPTQTPRIDAFVRAGRLAPVAPVLPAVTCSVQATYLTGTWPSEHGIVGNGWYFRDEAEVHFWKQSNKLVQRPMVWDLARQRDPDRKFTCANICWWFAMYSSADYTVTPRPMYPADGRKIPDCWTNPPELRDQFQRQPGPFPLFQFWGPGTTINSTRWIAEAAIKVDQQFDPTLTLVYLPHLDYGMQRKGPDASADDLKALDVVVGRLIDHFKSRGARVILLSEYGITPVSKAIHLNRVLRENGLLAIRTELGRELLDAGASAAFAVADHQVAHVYVNDPTRVESVASILEKTPGVARVLREADQRQAHIDHPRAGELMCLAEPDAWFTYYYWLDDARAPDFARTVDIHRKPGYDPVELFVDPGIRLPHIRIGSTILLRRLGFRKLLDVIPLDALLVRGSHGLPPRDPADGAMIATNSASLLDRNVTQPTDVCSLILDHLDCR
jgi:predicted AlkP superfamily pyrophosphatase or phosphodiesterase